jgi:hypothetical protein
MNLLQEIFGIVPTVPGSWTIPGPAGNAAMMGSVLEQRNGGMMLVDPHSSGEALLALRAEAAARGAELVVIDHGSPRWEEEFVARFEQATTTGRVVWLATDMGGQSSHNLEGVNLAAWFGPLNTLLDDNRMFQTSSGVAMSLPAHMRVLFVAPPTAMATMSPATIARLGMVDATS